MFDLNPRHIPICRRVKSSVGLDFARNLPFPDGHRLIFSPIGKEPKMKILVGYDGSNSAKEALKLARAHAQAFGGRVEIVESLPGGSATEAAQIQTAEEDLLYAKTVCEKENIACKTHLLVRGLTAGEDLVKFAAENQIEEIIIGVKRRSKVGKLIFGSNAQYIILNASCPVVSVK